MRINVIVGIFLFGLSVGPRALLAQGNKKITIEITNTAPADYKQELINIPWKDIVAIYPDINTAFFKVIHGVTKKEIPFQLEYRGKSIVQNILLQTDVAGNSSVKIYLQKGKPAPANPKTYCRYVPERKDDFAWENDKIAFRMYGKAIEGTRENAYGIDVWVKRTDRLILNERYKKADYHVDHGDGLDYYHVGLTLGAGNIAPYIDDSIFYSKNYREWKVLDNGPLRSTFQLLFDEWNVAGRKLSMIKTVSLDAGSHLSRIEVSFNSGDSLPVVAGIVKRKEPGTILLNEQDGIMGYWEPKHINNGTTGTGTIFLNPVVKMKVNNEHLLAQSTAVKDEPFVYYTGAAWDKAGLIIHSKDWFTYLQLFQQKLKQPLLVKLL